MVGGNTRPGASDVLFMFSLPNESRRLLISIDGPSSLILTGAQAETKMEDLKRTLDALKAAHHAARSARRDTLTYLIEVAIQQAEYEIGEVEKRHARH